jgi:hypothetical protein
MPLLVGIPGAVWLMAAWVLAGCSTHPPTSAAGTRTTEPDVEARSPAPETPEPSDTPELLAETPAPTAAPTPPLESVHDCPPDPVMPTASNANWPDHIPEHERPFLAQQMRSALWQYKDERCPCGFTASWRNREGGEVKRAPPTPWVGTDVGIRSLMPDLRIDQASPLRLKAMVLNEPIRWFSDLDGEIGRRSELLIPGKCLTAGTHRIEARQTRDGEIVALGSVEVLVQTVLERLKENGSTPNVVVLQKDDWEMVGKNLFVDVYVANRGGGAAKEVTLTLSGIGLAAGEGEGWTCEWNRLAGDSVEDGAGARDAPPIGHVDPQGCSTIPEPTPTRELQCRYGRIPGGKDSFTLRLEAQRSDDARGSFIYVGGKVETAGEIKDYDNTVHLNAMVSEGKLVSM